ncbi:uncharacterized protein LOC660404 [Tribolium castaneum]|uniref:CHK kinase-like domain-containing protein n=1 Tax=Tribolium castaneum TaxID=7070 RepID=D6WG50_TRICA|nr:PREDICTED: uncharacterized protein LOC660404 [Tribolium castaneum]EFA00204.1 hypothetical protein TcasGA2_TC003029 [Tribolium castaneum]|eukprot:XP_971728.1 PREDICTED: uncharacterized protein LOC660404 [Tribolium castaneum]
MTSDKIENLDNLIAEIIPKNYAFVDAKITRLTASGDNYGSLLLAVDITVKNEKENKLIHAVAKRPPSNKLVQELFNSQFTFPNEVGFYQTIIPCLRQFQQEQGVKDLISCFPEFYTARLSKDATGKVDESSVLLIKNIKKEGFQTLDRTVGFNLEQGRFILGKMAEMHATSLALKILRPEEFKSKLGPFLQQYKVFEMAEEDNRKMINVSLNVVKEDDVCRKYLPQIEEFLWKNLDFCLTKNIKTSSPSHFLTLTHCDLWVNNIMVKFDKNSRITEVKFVDFQLYEYASFVRDVVFFIFSSVQTSVLKESCDDLLLHYFDSLIKHLVSLKCDTKLFTYDAFLDEIKSVVHQGEFFHVLTMLPPIFAAEKDTKEVEALELHDVIFHESEVTETHREKAYFVVKEFIRRGWLFQGDS